ncbi:MAG: amidase [Sciscionella sp.]
MAETVDMTFTASELVTAYAAGERSPVDATKAVLRQIAAHNDTLNAYCLVDDRRALEDAKASEERWQHGHPNGLLDGVPTSVKDLFLTEGWPTMRGSRCVPPDQDWHVDSPAVARLREHGAVMLGKTATPEIGWKAVTDSPLTGVTRNPWNPELTPGGSSGGSAAAVAAGMGPLSVGTDGGGSLRIPASFCGITAFKPTFGRVPVYPVSHFGTLSHAGPMAWSVDDIALMMDVLALPDPRDPTALAPPLGSYREAVRRDVRGLIAAFSVDLGYAEVDPEVAEIVRGAVEALDDAGLRVEVADPGFADPLEAFDVLWSLGASRWADSLPSGSLAGVDPGLVALAERGRSRSNADYFDAQDERMALGIHMGHFHERYDILITPTVGIPAFAAGHDVPPSSSYSDWQQWAQFSYPFNLTQQPAGTVPAGRTGDGRPVGMQVVGPRHSDDMVLAVCRLLEAVRPWYSDRPDLTG